MSGLFWWWFSAYCIKEQ